MAPFVLPDSAAVGSEGLASCEWSDEVEIDGAGDGLGGCVCVVLCPFIVQKLAGVLGDGGVDRDLRVGTSVRGATPVAIAEPTGSEKVRICRFLECVRRRDVGRLGMYRQRALPKPRTVRLEKLAEWITKLH